MIIDQRERPSDRFDLASPVRRLVQGRTRAGSNFKLEEWSDGRVHWSLIGRDFTTAGSGRCRDEAGAQLTAAIAERHA